MRRSSVCNRLTRAKYRGEVAQMAPEAAKNFPKVALVVKALTWTMPALFKRIALPILAR